MLILLDGYDRICKVFLTVKQFLTLFKRKNIGIAKQMALFIDTQSYILYVSQMLSRFFELFIPIFTNYTCHMEPMCD